MTPYQKKFTKIYAKELLRVAIGDLATARVLIEHPGGRPENTLFLLQQAVEKSLKAVLCHFDLPVPLTHDLGALLGTLPPQAGNVPGNRAILGLTEFASIRRYEEGKYEYTSAEVDEAYRSTKQILEWVQNLTQKI